ncbi:MAG: PAS domain S-box protein [Candidatus Thermoplasmatota archaeon]|nr:PAS domain S-box protein [Candidatus Thermoplasmatota archaeon]
MDPTERTRLKDELLENAPYIAQNWMKRAFQGTMDGDREGVLTALTGLVERSVLTLYIGPFDPQVAMDIGSSVSKLRNRAPDLLGRSLNILSFELTKKLTPPQLHSLFHDLTSFMAYFSTGFHRTALSFVTKDHDSDNRAIMSDLLEADRKLRLTNEHLEALVEDRTLQLRNLNESLRSEIETRKEAEEKLGKRETLLSAVFDTTLIWTELLDTEGSILLSNQQAADFVGMEKDKLTGMLFWEAPWWKDDPPLKEKVKRSILKARKGEHIRFDVENFNLKGRIRDIELSVRPVKNEQGEVVYIIPEGIDITRRKRIERELEHARDELKSIIENTSDILFSFDENGTLTYISPQIGNLGLDRDRMVGKDSRQLIDIVHPLDRDLARESLKRRFNDLEDSPIIYRFVDRDGHVRWLEETIHIVSNEDGKLVSINGVMRDVTTRKEIEEELLKLNEVLKLINRIMRHDIKNRLTVIYGLLGLVMERKVYDPAIQRYILTSVKRSIELTRKMGELESLVFRKKDRKEYDPGILIREISADLPLKISIQGNCRVVADDALSSVFQNLISNAIIHGRASSMDVRISSGENTCTVEITDNGKGIPENIREMLFHGEFSWGDTKGSGIGLYITNKIMESYGGTIRLGESGGQGAQFILEFPISGGD